MPVLLPKTGIATKMSKVKKIVVDSSVAVKWINSQNETLLSRADKLLSDFEFGKVELFAPELLKYEVGNAILNKKMDLPAIKASLATLYSIPIKFIPLSEDMGLEALAIAAENKVTYYDAVFVSLAKELAAVLVTDNPKHQKTSRGVKTIPLRNY